MLIIAGYSTVDAEKQDEYVAAFRDLVQRARAYEGCLDVAVTADPVDPTRIYVFEVWDSEESLQKWRKIANAPSVDILRSDVKKYEISSVGPPL